MKNYQVNNEPSLEIGPVYHVRPLIGLLTFGLNMSDIRTSTFWSKLLEKILQIIGKNLSAGRKSNSKHQHVVPHEEGWAVRGEGNSRITASYKYQDDAIDRARDIASNYKSDVIVHGKDGRIRDRFSAR
jgi:hypothetical protein